MAAPPPLCMTHDHVVYSVLGMFATLGLVALLFAPRQRRFQTDAFRSLPEATRRQKLRRARLGGLVLVVVSAIGVVGFGIVEGLTRRLQHRHGLHDMADEMARSLPKMVGPGTRWDAVFVEDGTLVYTYTLVSTPAAKVDRVAMATAAKQLPNDVCAITDAREALDAGATFRFEYQDMNHRPVADYAVRASDCPR
jgi:hypothetical protein